MSLKDSLKWKKGYVFEFNNNYLTKSLNLDLNIYMLLDVATFHKDLLGYFSVIPSLWIRFYKFLNKFDGFEKAFFLTYFNDYQTSLT